LSRKAYRRRPSYAAKPYGGGQLFTFLAVPGLGATNWRAELAIRFGVILRKVWGGSRTWAGARAQSVMMSV
jgi:transposase